jgi:hypothetical protein
MRTFVAGSTKIDVIAHIRQDNLELHRLVLTQFEGSEPIANAAFRVWSSDIAASSWPNMPWHHGRSTSVRLRRGSP